MLDHTASPSAEASLVDPDLLHQGLPLERFAALRRSAPVWWNAEPVPHGGFDDGGFWAITKHAHASQIVRDSETWSANANGGIIGWPADTGKEVIEGAKALLSNHEGPEHIRLRKLVSPLFNPRAMRALEEKMHVAAAEIVREARELGSGNFAEDVAAKLPLLMIADLLGIPEPDRAQVYRWSTAMTSFADDDNDDDAVAANLSLMTYAYELAEARRKNPTDDIISRLVNADNVDARMSETEFGFLVLQLAVAGHETTRNAIAQGLGLFLDNPDQWELFKRERPPTTADEIVRYVCPIYVAQRTATRDVEIGGITVRRGERAGVFWASANFDDEVFADPLRFDILRSPNPHLGFGSGAHVCLGAHLARREIGIMLGAIADHLPDITKIAEPERLRSAMFNSVKTMPVSYA